MRPFLTLHDPSRAAAYYDAGLWTDDTFYSLLSEWAERRPTQPALRDGRQNLNWQQLKGRVDAMADDLASHGLVAGDRISLWMSNRLEAVVVFLACSREGYACNPSLHKTFTCAEIIELLNRLQTAVLVTEDEWGADRTQQDFQAMLDGLPFLKKVYSPDEFPHQRTAQDRQVHSNPDSVAYLAFTSGTTGTPKCVMHSCNTLLANARDLVRDWSLGAETIIMTLSPLSHHIAWVAVGQWLVAGCQLVTDDPPEGLSQLDWIVETRTTYVLGVPTHAMDILQEQRTRGLERIGDVRIFYMAGAPIPAVVAEAFVNQGITPQNIYGMTENSSHQYTHPDDPPETWIATCGRGGPGYEVRIFDPEDDERELEPGETGQIGGRGAVLMLGYFGNQEATENSFNRSGWFLSGDLGSFDKQGNLRIEGRLKDLIIRGGHNIYPSRIEALALTHDNIDKAAAFGVPDERLGEKVCLAIMGDLTGEQVLEHLAAEGLSTYDMPEWFVAVEAFPMTASGKILKHELAAMLARGELRPCPVRYHAK
jgi:acyl-CoA synthetase